MTLSLGEVPAKVSASQDEEKDWMANLASCSSIYELYVTLGRAGFSGRTCPEYFQSTTDERSEHLSLHYKTSGMAWRGECLTVNSSEWHNDAAVSFLSDVLEKSEVPQRFYLSATACRGILRRAERREKSLPKRLEAALIAQSASKEGVRPQ